MVEIIEHLRGVDFRKALRTHVLDPIGLDSFLLGPDAATQVPSSSSSLFIRLSRLITLLRLP